MSSDREELRQAEQRLGQIQEDFARLYDEAQEVCDKVLSTVEQATEKAKLARDKRAKLEDLKAEALYLRLLHNLPLEEFATPETRLDEGELAWKGLRSASLPVRPSSLWLEKIRELERSRSGQAVLSAEERAELERRLKDNVCPICVSFALDGTCTLESFETCPIDLYLGRLVTMIEELGHRPWMEDYFERMYRDICPGCSGRVDQDYCPPREEGECSLFTYLPTVIRTIESFLRERNELRRTS